MGEAVPELSRARAQVSSSLPSTSYRQGVRSAALHDLYAPALTAALGAALKRFEASMPGLLCDDAVLYGAETRTSSPVRCLHAMQAEQLVCDAHRREASIRVTRDSAQSRADDSAQSHTEHGSDLMSTLALDRPFMKLYWHDITILA